MSENNSIKTRSTQICHKKFPETKLKTHSGIQLKTKTITCNVCAKNFTTRSYLKIHQRIHTGEKPYQCSICDKRSLSLNTHKSHMQTHNSVKPHKCDICDKSFARKSTLKIHKRYHDLIGGTRHKCDVCGQCFVWPHLLNAHMLKHSTVVYANKCEVCDKTFGQMSELNAHKIEVHTSVKKPFKCLVCDERYEHRHEDVRLTLRTVEEKLYKCQVCDETFGKVDELTRHSVVHVSEKSHKCQVCDETFKQISELTTHSGTHNNKKLDKCDEAFTQMSGQMSRTHNSDKPYTRNVRREHLSQQMHGMALYKSNETFTQQVREHRTYSQTRTSHKCPVCDETFEQMDDLRTHSMTHVGGSYKCQICYESFAIFSNLRAHVLIAHRGIKPYICDEESIDIERLMDKVHECNECHMRFYHKIDLIGHLLIHVDDVERRRNQECAVRTNCLIDNSMNITSFVPEPSNCDECSTSGLETRKTQELTYYEKESSSVPIINDISSTSGTTDTIQEPSNCDEFYENDVEIHKPLELVNHGKDNSFVHIMNDNNFAHRTSLETNTMVHDALNFDTFSTSGMETTKTEEMTNQLTNNSVCNALDSINSDSTNDVLNRTSLVTKTVAQEPNCDTFYKNGADVLKQQELSNHSVDNSVHIVNGTSLNTKTNIQQPSNYSVYPSTSSSTSPNREIQPSQEPSTSTQEPSIRKTINDVLHNDFPNATRKTRSQKSSNCLVYPSTSPSPSNGPSVQPSQESSMRRTINDVTHNDFLNRASLSAQTKIPKPSFFLVYPSTSSTSTGPSIQPSQEPSIKRTANNVSSNNFLNKTSTQTEIQKPIFLLYPSTSPSPSNGPSIQPSQEPSTSTQENSVHIINDVSNKNIISTSIATHKATSQKPSNYLVCASPSSSTDPEPSTDLEIQPSTSTMNHTINNVCKNDFLDKTLLTAGKKNSNYLVYPSTSSSTLSGLIFQPSQEPSTSKWNHQPYETYLRSHKTKIQKPSNYLVYPSTSSSSLSGLIFQPSEEPSSSTQEPSTRRTINGVSNKEYINRTNIQKLSNYLAYPSPSSSTDPSIQPSQEPSSSTINDISNNDCLNKTLAIPKTKPRKPSNYLVYPSTSSSSSTEQSIQPSQEPSTSTVDHTINSNQILNKTQKTKSQRPSNYDVYPSISTSSSSSTEPSIQPSQEPSTSTQEPSARRTINDVSYNDFLDKPLLAKPQQPSNGLIYPSTSTSTEPSIQPSQEPSTSTENNNVHIIYGTSFATKTKIQRRTHFPVYPSTSSSSSTEPSIQPSKKPSTRKRNHQQNETPLKPSNYDEYPSISPSSSAGTSTEPSIQPSKKPSTRKRNHQQNETPQKPSNYDVYPSISPSSSTGTSTEPSIQPSQQPSTIRKTTHICDICGKEFTAKSQHTRHVKTHKKCVVCQKEFKTRLQYDRHMSEHKKSWECVFCLQLFLTEAELKTHVKSAHLVQKSYECKVCNTFFVTSGELLIHQRIHTGEQKYECRVCKQSFMNSAHYAYHVKTHKRDRY